MRTLDTELLDGRDDEGTGALAELPGGSQVGRYVILSLLGKGGMGLVYKAYDPQLDRGVALKLIVPSRDESEEPAGSARLLREAQALAQLSHPHVVNVHDVGTFEHGVFVAMELVDGRTLDAWLRERPRSVPEILAVMRAAGEGLSAAHGASLVHRDFKPSNVLVGNDGRVRVIDFGLARAETTRGPALDEPYASSGELGADHPSPAGMSSPAMTPRSAPSRTSPDGSAPSGTSPDRSAPSGSSRNGSASSGRAGLLASPLTRRGAIVGTPVYMSLEQHLGAELDFRSDQFSFCVTLYEALYGVRPFSGLSHKELIHQISKGEVRPPPASRNVPKWIERVVRRGLSKHPNERYPSMAALLDDLAGDPDEARRRERAARVRRWLVVLAAPLLIAAPLAVGYGLKWRRAQVCKHESGDVHAVWGAGPRDAIRRAFLATEKPYAASAWVRVEKTLDGYLGQWTAMRDEACEATWLRGSQSEETHRLRMGCLSTRLRDLQTLLDVFAKADATVVEKAVQASASLASLATCTDDQALRAPYPPPGDPRTQDEVAAIRARLSEVNAQKNTGKPKDGLPLARELLARAKATGYVPIEAEATTALGELEDGAGDYPSAEDTLKRAAQLAAEGKNALLAAKAMASLVNIVGFRMARHEAGLAIGRDTELLLALGGGDERVASRLLNSMGVVLWAVGRYDEARDYYERSLQIDERTLGPEHPNVATSLNNLGLVYRALGKLDETRRYYDRALAIYEKNFGPEHPEVAMLLTNFGVLLQKQGKYDEALPYHERSLRIDADVFGSDHAYVGMDLDLLGSAYHSLGRLDDAERYYRRGLEVRERALGPEHQEVAESLNNLGFLAYDRGDYDGALLRFERATKIVERLPGLEGPKLTWSLMGLGKTLAAKGDAPGAKEHLLRAVAICDKASCEHECIGEVKLALAKLLWAAPRDRAHAVELARQARAELSLEGHARKALSNADAWLHEHGEARP